MPKINVYLPDDLAAAVKDLGLPVSPICQHALETAVRRVSGLMETAKLDLTGDDPTARLKHFTDKSRAAVSFAIQRARDSGVAMITTEHLLAGILDEGANLALQVLHSMEIEPDDLREDMAARPAPTSDDEAPGRQLDTSAAAALKAALHEAITFGHNYIGCEHLLLGLINEPDGGAGEILRSRGAEPRLARRTVGTLISGYVYAKSQAAGGADQSGAAALRDALTKIGERLDRLEARVGSE
jgi:ATP-dependent Clp protease ATP-binding subunit ClpC